MGRTWSKSRHRGPYRGESMKRLTFGLLLAGVMSCSTGASSAPAQADPGFTKLFNGKDLTGWKIPEGDGGHWKVVNGAIDYDASSEAKDKNLWTVKSYKNFELMVD